MNILQKKDLTIKMNEDNVDVSIVVNGYLKSHLVHIFNDQAILELTMFLKDIGYIEDSKDLYFKLLDVANDLKPVVKFNGNLGK